MIKYYNNGKAIFFHKFLGALFFLCVALPLWGARGEIEFLRYEHNKIIDGQKCLSLHFRLLVSGLKGEYIKVTAYFESPKDVGLPDTNGNYCTKNGKVCVSKSDDATYDNTKWTDFTLNIPNDEIHALPGKHTYYVEALLWHKGTVLARTYCDTFTMTGETSGQQKRNNNYNITNKWIENSTQYGFVEVFLYSNGIKKSHFYGRCPNCLGSSKCGMCHGTGICSFCSGQGGRYLREAGYWNPCDLCKSTGRCLHCAGNNGNCTLCNGNLGHDHPGYVCNVVQTIFPDGKSISEKIGYQWRSDHWVDTHEAQRRSSCSKCGGTGVDPQPSSSGPNHEWIAEYIEIGEKCPYCNCVGAHWHSRCPNCNVPTHY
ncbi:MAG: hypothetical protein K2N28_08270 [Muribaculaceae bacterium]|nr:hypothetical protein [Muribaculaceae bacterium]